MLAPSDNALFGRSAHLRLRGGRTVIVRPVEHGDEAALQAYFRNLSVASRYSRTLGAASELPAGELVRTFETDIDHHSLIVISQDATRDTVIGEARLAHDTRTDDVEVSLSVADDWQGNGIGTALFAHLKERAAQFGTVAMYGDTLRSNAAMIGLAKKAGFHLIATPGDWRLVRFHKVIDYAAATIATPCGWIGAATDRSH